MGEHERKGVRQGYLILNNICVSYCSFVTVFCCQLPVNLYSWVYKVTLWFSVLYPGSDGQI